MRLFAIVLLSLLLAACGYRLQGRDDALPGEVRYVYVELLGNATYEPFLENGMTNALIDRLARSPAVELVEQPDLADALLTGTVLRYDNDALSYAGDDDIVEYRVRMTVETVLRRAENAQVLWKGQASWTEDYLASVNKTAEDDREEAAVGEIDRRLADELYGRLVDGF